METHKLSSRFACIAYVCGNVINPSLLSLLAKAGLFDFPALRWVLLIRLVINRTHHNLIRQVGTLGGCGTLDGRQVSTLQKGVNISRMNVGTTKKLLVR